MVEKSFKVIMIVLIFSLFITSCTSQRVTNDDDLIVQTEKNNVLNLGMDSVDTLNPILSKSTSVRECMQLVFEPLFTFDEALNPICVLAESCTVSDDAYSYLLKIKEGVFWHDGTEMTARDVQHTINLIRYNDSFYTKLLNTVSSVSYVDKYTLKLGVSRPVPNFTALLSFPVVQSKATAEVENYIPIGTGPYMYSGKVSSGKLELVPNGNWRGNIASIDKVHLNIVKDNQSLINAFNASSVNVLTSNVMDLKNNTPRGENNINDYTSNNLVFLGINNSKSEFSGKNTRQAISYLVDRESIVTEEVFSKGVTVKTPVNPSSWYNPKSSSDKHETEYIKELLSLDGWNFSGGVFKREKEIYSDGSDTPSLVSQTLSVTIIVNEGNSERKRIAEKIASGFNAFGIETFVKMVSFEEYQQRIQDKNYTMFIGEIQIPYNMDLYSLVCGDNYFSYSSQDMNSIIYRVGTAQSTEEIKTAFSEFSVQFLSDVPFVPLFFRKESVIFEKNISGVTMPTIFTAFREPENWYITYKKAADEER